MVGSRAEVETLEVRLASARASVDRDERELDLVKNDAGFMTQVISQHILGENIIRTFCSNCFRSKLRPWLSPSPSWPLSRRRKEKTPACNRELEVEEEEEEEEEEAVSATTAPSASRGQGKFSAARLDIFLLTGSSQGSQLFT